jgi:hypothetical protein
VDGLDAEHRESAAAREQPRGARAGGEVQVRFEDGTQPGFFTFVYLVQLDEVSMKHLVGFAAENIGEAACHAGAEIQAERAEDENDPAGHVLAAVLADAFDDG